MSTPTTTVVVVTYERPEYVARCLDHLAAQTVPADEIMVVDSSDGDATRVLVTERFPAVAYEVNPLGRGATARPGTSATARRPARSLAFVDDDAFAEPDWLERLAPPL